MNLCVNARATVIPPEILDRIFDPFFTTKEQGKGTGLGLATASGIVRNHNGFIRVESRVGEGTQFRVYLPAAPDKVAESPRETAAPPTGRGEMILVVDDEENVRAMTQRLLMQNNYRVLQASEGSEALVLFTQHAEEIQAVLTDLLMPLMDGVALIRALQKLAPGVRILATTGDAEAMSVAAVRRLGVKLVLLKPCQPHVLLRNLRAVIDGCEESVAGGSTPPIPV